MKKFVALLSLLLVFAIISNLSAQTSNTWTKEEADKWFLGNKWLNGLKLNVHESVNRIEFAKQYHKNKAVWDKAFAFLRDSDLLNMAPGKHPIDGNNVYASVTEGPAKDFQNTKCETHVKYIDIQYVIKGKEKMGVSPAAEVATITPYDSTKDVAFHDCKESKFFEAVPGTFFIFFPSDAHRPGIKADGFDIVKKIVIKIRVVE